MKYIFLKLMFKYCEELHAFHNDSSFLPGKMKIEEVEKLLSLTSEI